MLMVKAKLLSKIVHIDETTLTIVKSLHSFVHLEHVIKEIKFIF